MKGITEELHFKSNITTLSLGRNGISITKGIYLYHDNSNIDIFPINSKGNVSRCRISIPTEYIDELIIKLKEIIK